MMNISMRDKKILLMLLGVCLFAAGYFIGYQPQMEKAQKIQASNVPLEQRLKELLELAKNKEFYVEETNLIQEEISKYLSEFPADIKQEDGIVLSQDLEEDLDIKISNVGLGSSEFVVSLDGSSEEELLSMPEQTLSEQANAQTQEQIDEIEGIEKYKEVAQPDVVEVTSVPALYRTQNSMQFTGTYESLKELVEYLADRSGRMTLDQVSASFDPTSGNLSGNLTINLFSMTGTGKSYTQPDAGTVSYGTKNIFGTIEKKND